MPESTSLRIPIIGRLKRPLGFLGDREETVGERGRMQKKLRREGEERERGEGRERHTV